MNVTNLIVLWVECCQDIWSRWFANRNDGQHEFTAIECSLLEVLVVDKLLEEGLDLTSDTIFHHLKVRYRNEDTVIRSYCRKQKAGNVFCESREVHLSEVSMYSIHDVDTVGTMMDGIPYVEVNIDNGFILESYRNLEFFLLEGQMAEWTHKT